MQRGDKLTIFLVSGGTGRTCDHVLNAALAQFDHRRPQLVHRSKVRSTTVARQTVEDAAKADAILFHTVVDPDVRAALVETARILQVTTIDILGPTLAALQDHLQSSPRRQPGRAHENRDDYFNRASAVDFTLAHDDGQLLKTIDRADVVLVGVSRVSKSVTCFYLAYRGVRAANVPFINRQDVPTELLELDSNKVVGLTMNPRRLTRLREARAETLGGGGSDDYIAFRDVAWELNYANRVMDQHGWHRIDVSYKSVEEVASEILRWISLGESA